jgi:hypothetical protein
MDESLDGNLSRPVLLSSRDCLLNAMIVNHYVLNVWIIVPEMGENVTMT